MLTINRLLLSLASCRLWPPVGVTELHIWAVKTSATVEDFRTCNNQDDYKINLSWMKFLVVLAPVVACSFTEGLVLNTTGTPCSVQAILRRNMNKSHWKHLGSHWGLLYVTNCRVFYSLYKVFCSYRNIMFLSWKKKAIFFYSHFSVYKFQISVSLNCIRLEYLIPKIAAWIPNLSYVKKMLCEFWLGIKTALLTIRKIDLE